MVRNGTRVDRRQVLKGIGVAATAVTAGTAAALGAPSIATANALDPSHAGAPRTDSPVAAPGESVLAFFGPLVPGTSLGAWHIVAIHDTKVGGIPVVLASAYGVQFQVDVVRRDDSAGAPPAIANTPTLSVFLLNGGDGSTATMEHQGLGAMALAAALTERESSGARAPQLLSLRERTSRFPRVVYEVVY